MHKIFLKDRFFVILGSLVVFATLSPINRLFLLPSIIGMVVLFLLLFLEKKNSLNSNDLVIDFNIPRWMNIDSDHQINFSVRVNSLNKNFNNEIMASFDDELQICFYEPKIFKTVENIDGLLKGIIHVNPRLIGLFDIKQIYLIQKSKLGLLEKHITIKFKLTRVRVMPSIKKVPEQKYIDILNKSFNSNLGKRKLTRMQSREQFRGIREYQFGEPFINIDHKKSARLSAWVRREYETYTDHHLIIILDLGRTYRGDLDGTSKSHYIISSAINLVKNALESGDRVSVVGLDHKERFQIRESRSFEDFYNIFNSHKTCSPANSNTNFAILPEIIGRITGRRSLVILFTDTSRSSIQKQLSKYCSSIFHKHQLGIISLLDYKWDILAKLEIEDNKKNIDDYLHLLYCIELEEMNKVFSKTCRSLGGSSITVPTQYWMSTVERLYKDLRSTFLN